MTSSALQMGRAVSPLHDRPRRQLPASVVDGTTDPFRAADELLDQL